MKRDIVIIISAIIVLLMTGFLSGIAFSRFSHRYTAIDCGGAVCVMEKSECKLIWIPDTKEIEKQMGASLDNLYYDYRVFDPCKNIMISTRYRKISDSFPFIVAARWDIKCDCRELEKMIGYKYRMRIFFFNPEKKITGVLEIDPLKKRTDFKINQLYEESLRRLISNIPGLSTN